MAVKGAGVHIYGDWDGSGVKRATKDLSRFEKQAQGFASNFTRSFAGIGASIGGAVAFGAIADQMKQMAQAAAQDQKSVVALGKTMQNLGLATEQSGVEGFIKSMMLATGVADDQLRPALSRLLRSTQDVAESQKALQIALDISAATGKDLDTVANGLGKAYDGNAASLGRLGLGLDKALLKSGDMGKITDELTAKFGGQASAAAATYAGQMQRLDTAVGEAQETIGYALLNSLSDVTQAFGGTGGLIDTVTAAGESVADFTTGLGEMVSQMAKVSAGGNDTSLSIADIATAIYKVVPQTGLLINAYEGIASRGEAARQKEEALNDEINRSMQMRHLYTLEVSASAAAARDEAFFTDRAATAVKALNGALEKRNGANRSIIGANIQLRRMKAEGPQDTNGNKKISMDERRQFGLDYASTVDQKYNALVEQGKLRKAQQLLAGARGYLGQQVGPGFAASILGTPKALPKAIAARDSARAEAGANQWRQSMSSVFQVDTIVVQAQTPAQAVQKAKEWARLAATGRGPVAPPIDTARNPDSGWGHIR